MANGRKYGGCYVSERLYTFLDELKSDYDRIKKDEKFSAELNELLTGYLGRPAPLFFAKKFAEYLKGGKIYLKREDLTYTGSAAAVNVLGHVLLACKLGKREIITVAADEAEALAAALVGRHLDMNVRIYAVQDFCVSPKIQKSGAQLIVRKDHTLKDLLNVCFLDWQADPIERYFLPFLPVGPQPLPEITRDFQSLLGLEIQELLQDKEKNTPDFILADISMALGAFYPFLKSQTELIVLEPVQGSDTKTPLLDGRPGVFQGAYTKFLQHDNGQLKNYLSPCAGLAYPAAPPELAYLQDNGRITVRKVNQLDITAAADLFRQTEGIQVSMRSAVVLAELMQLAPTVDREKILVGVLHGTELEN